MLYAAIVFLPIVGSIIAGLFGRVIGARASEVITTALLFVSTALSCYALYDAAWLGHSAIVRLIPWITSGMFSADWALRVRFDGCHAGRRQWRLIAGPLLFHRLHAGLIRTDRRVSSPISRCSRSPC